MTWETTLDWSQAQQFLDFSSPEQVSGHRENPTRSASCSLTGDKERLHSIKVVLDRSRSEWISSEQSRGSPCSADVQLANRTRSGW